MVDASSWADLIVTLKSVPMRSALLSVSKRTKIEPARHDNIPPSTLPLGTEQTGYQPMICFRKVLN